jgi:hypothetical protein
LEAAFAAADAEIGEATPIDTDETMPVTEVEADASGEQATASQDEQPDVAETTDDAEVDNELQSLVDEIAAETEGEAEGDTSDADPVEEFLASDDFWSTEVEVDLGDGPERKSIRELTDGYLRQADYTKKTQAIADEKSRNADATEFFRVFEQDPVSFARALAVKANLIEPGTEPIAKIDVAKFTSPEEYQAEIDRRVEERFTSDPRFTEMQTTSARNRVNEVFNGMEQDRGIKLSPELRQHLIDIAVRTNTTDFNQVLDAEMYRKQQARSRAEQTQRKAPNRPSSPGTTSERGKPLAVVADIDEAFERALASVQ